MHLPVIYMDLLFIFHIHIYIYIYILSNHIIVLLSFSFPHINTKKMSHQSYFIFLNFFYTLQVKLAILVLQCALDQCALDVSGCTCNNFNIYQILIGTSKVLIFWIINKIGYELVFQDCFALLYKVILYRNREFV